MNGQPGALIRDAEGRLVAAYAVDVAGGAVRTLRSVINPEKLRHLGEPADFRALAARRRHPV